MKRNRLAVYPDNTTMVFGDPFQATIMQTRLLHKGAAVLTWGGAHHIFTDLKPVEHFDIGQEYGTTYTARYAGMVPE